MEIKTTFQIKEDVAYRTSKIPYDKKWVAVDDEIKEAIALYYHLKAHTEVKNATMYRGMPICTICKKSAYQIMAEEWESLSTSTEGTELMFKNNPCPKCNGTGYIPNWSNECEIRCPECNKIGKARL